MRDAAIPALLVATGWWVVWLPILAWTSPRWKRLGDRVGRALQGILGRVR
jgi:hypothetical protein